MTRFESRDCPWKIYKDSIPICKDTRRFYGHCCMFDKFENCPEPENQITRLQSRIEKLENALKKILVCPECEGRRGYMEHVVSLDDEGEFVPCPLCGGSGERPDDAGEIAIRALSEEDHTK